MATTSKKRKPLVKISGKGSHSKAPDRRIILCLSGGGLRATLFHIGCIRALRENSLLQNVNQIFAVSGGSILAAHLVLNWEKYIKSGDSFDQISQEVTNFTSRDVRGRIIRRYICTSIAWFLPKWATPFARSLVEHLEGQYRTLFSNFTFADLKTLSPNAPDLHVIAASLTTGQSCSFSKEGFYEQDSERTVTRRSSTNTTTFARAVAASSAFPPLFPPVVITGRDLGEPKSNFSVDHKLADGGVIDNLAIEKVFALEERKEILDHHIVVSDAGGLFDWNVDSSISGYVGRNVRASTIMMNEISLNTMRKIKAKITKGEITFCSIDDETDGPLPRDVQKSLRTIRTDLDQFSSGEIDALQTHGYHVTKQCLLTSRLSVLPVQRISSAQLNATTSSTFAELRRSARRKLRLISFQDWVSIPAVLIVVGLPIFFFVALYAGYSLLTTQITETGNLTGDITKITDVNSSLARENAALNLALQKLEDQIVTLENSKSTAKVHSKCRDPSHGIESYMIDQVLQGDSGWRSGGYDQNQWCDEYTARLRGKYPTAVFKKISSNETQRSRCRPFNCPEYKYTCKVDIKSNPVFNAAVSAACPLETNQ